MKYQLLLWSLVTMIFGLESFNLKYKAEPASIFHPIIGDIRNQIPSSLQMRLPASIANFSEDISLYAFIPDDDLDFFSMGEENLDTFMVIVSETPDCQMTKNPIDCTVGIVGVSETSSQSDLELDDLPNNIADLSPLELNHSAKGFYFIQDEDYQLVVWKQDRLAHLLITETCDDGCLLKQDLIDMAKSAANEPAITNRDSSYHSY